jgi:hypothetical protein
MLFLFQEANSFAGCFLRLLNGQGYMFVRVLEAFSF